MKDRFTVAEIIQWTGGRLVNGSELGPAVETIRIQKPSPLKEARSSDVAFFFSRDYEQELPFSAAGVLITGEPFAEPLKAARLPFWSKTAVVACVDPYLAMALISEHLAPALSSGAHLSRPSETVIHPSAVVHPSAQVGAGVQIGPHCVVEDGVTLGAGTILYPGCVIGADVEIGQDCVLFARVCVYEKTVMGNRVRIHAGAVIGADGFGYAPKRDGKQVAGHQKIYHLGRVVIGDDVEIGANACVDRGTFGDTWIGNNVKIDNLVQIGHNVRMDEGSVICGSAAMAGSSSLGKYAYVGGLTGIANKVHVGDGASVAACSLLSKDVPPGGTAVGNPQREYRHHFKAHAALNRLVADKKKT